jgi:hypothetical protein
VSKRFVASILVSALGLIGTSGMAQADSIGRYECNIIGPVGLEPIGDHDGHVLRSYDFSCEGVDGLFKGAVYTAISVSELDGSKASFHLGGGIHRAPAGLAVGQMLEGSGSTTMLDGRPRATASGTMMVRFASGTLASLSGKTLKWAAKPAGFNRFDMEFAD